MGGGNILANLNSLNQRNLCAKLSQIRPDGSGKEAFFLFRQLISAFSLYPSKKDRVLHLNKLESPSPEDALCQVSLKLV